MNDPRPTQDHRHLKRIKLMQLLFAAAFDYDHQQGLKKNDFVSNRLPFCEILQKEAEQILRSVAEIDQQLQKHAPERPLTEINLVDLAILRLIVWESLHKKTPKKVLIDEAVELAKEFGSESSPRFVNGVLGKLFKMEEVKSEIKEKEKPEKTQ